MSGGLLHWLEDFQILGWVLAGVIGVLVFAVVLGVTGVVNSRFNPARRRLAELDESDGPVRRRFGSRVVDSFDGLSPIILPKDFAESSKIRARLSQAGFRSESAFFAFFLIKFALALVFPVVVYFGSSFIANVPVSKQVFYAILAMSVGMFGPNMVLSSLVEKRQEKIRKGFADMLDLLVVCVEAGLGFDIALRRVSDDIRNSHPVLAEELAIVSGEIRAGVERVKALRNLADRTGLTDIRAFVALIAQSLRFGTSIADTLRIYSEDFRDKRIQAAEEKAAKVGTKMIFPLVFCFFPSFFLVAVGPAILAVLKTFSR